MSRAGCEVPGCDGAARYQFGTGAQTYERRCGRHGALYWPILRRALRIAAVVGTILFVINQSDVVLMGQVTGLVVAKIGLTYWYRSPSRRTPRLPPIDFAHLD